MEGGEVRGRGLCNGRDAGRAGRRNIRWGLRGGADRHNIRGGLMGVEGRDGGAGATAHRRPRPGG